MSSLRRLKTKLLRFKTYKLEPTHYIQNIFPQLNIFRYLYKPFISSRWEKEKILRKNRPQEEDTFEGDGENGEKDLQSEKQRDLEGTGSDEVPEPEEVRVARQELQLLQEEKAKTESLKAKVQKELEKAKKRAAQIEEVGLYSVIT